MLLVAHWECCNHRSDEKASCATVIVYYITTLFASKGGSVICKRCSLLYSRRHYVYWWGWQELKRSIMLIKAQREAPISTLLTWSQGMTCNHLPQVKYWMGFWLRCSDVKCIDGSSWPSLTLTSHLADARVKLHMSRISNTTLNWKKLGRFEKANKQGKQ